MNSDDPPDVWLLMLLVCVIGFVIALFVALWIVYDCNPFPKDRTGSPASSVRSR
jgi:hypothetical protein